jgi:hypothetical protein
MEYAAIQSAISSGTAMLQILEGLASIKLETETLAQIKTAQDKISEMIAVLFDSREELIKLLRENQELRAQLKRIVHWEETAAKYQLVSTAGGARVYELLEGLMKYYACPVCFAKNHLITAQTAESRTVENPTTALQGLD